jgi:hypothetical protein
MPGKARDAAKLTRSPTAVDPVQARKVEKLKASNPTGDTFKIGGPGVVRASQAPRLEPQPHADCVCLRQLERDLFPWLGEPPDLKEIDPADGAAGHAAQEWRSAARSRQPTGV